MALQENARPTAGEVCKGTASHTASVNPPSVFEERTWIFYNSTMDDQTKEYRREQVWVAQRQLNMVPRDDSRLTELFAMGQLPAYMTADVVARELMCTDFIYKNTLYGEIIEEYMRNVADYLRETYRISWDATWKITRFYAPIALKLMCVSSSCVRVPNALQAISCTN